MLGIILSLYRVFTKTKTVFGQILCWITAPFRAVGRFLFHLLLVPIYKLFLLLRRQTNRLYLPAKNKILFLFSNRHAIHGTIILISLFSVSANVRASNISMEELGGQSVLMKILGAETQQEYFEVTALAGYASHTTSYLGNGILESSRTSADYDLLAEAIMGSSSSMVPSSGSIKQIDSVSTRDTVESYIVQEGDTIGSIAESFDLSITTVLWANNLSVRSIIRPGDTLIVLPVDGVVHTVKNGETLSKIAKTYSVESEEIVSFNKLANANDLVIGESLLIPGGEKLAPASKPRVASVSNLFTSEQTTKSRSPLAGSASMIWPSDLGKINVYFAQWYIYGRHWGLDIDCNTNNTNYAAADGIVTTSSWNSGGYGNLVVIDHGNGLVTYYGHHAKLYVEKGQSVSQGDPIGLCGTTGRSTGNHLHFEVRVNGQQVNPLDYISYK